VPARCASNPGLPQTVQNCLAGAASVSFLIYSFWEINFYGSKRERHHAYALDPDAWQFKLDQNGTPIGAERKPSLPRIRLTTNAKDTDGDNLPELIADGKSKAIITAEVRDEQDRIVKRDFLVNLKTTGGALSARRVEAKAGRAEVELTSSLDTITATVSASGTGLKDAVPLTFEFMPSELK